MGKEAKELQKNAERIDQVETVNIKTNKNSHKQS